MAALTPEIKEIISKIDLFPFATAGRADLPNVIPVRYLFVVDDDTLWITDNYFQKTLANLRGNPQAALYVYSAETGACFQIKGPVEIKTSGPDYQRMREMAWQKKPDLPAKSLVVMHIAEVFECRPGAEAGKKLY